MSMNKLLHVIFNGGNYQLEELFVTRTLKSACLLKRTNVFSLAKAIIIIKYELTCVVVIILQLSNLSIWLLLALWMDLTLVTKCIENTRQRRQR